MSWSFIYYNPGLAFIAVWAGWAISWIAASVWSAKTEASAGAGAGLWYRIVLLVGGVAFFVPAHDTPDWMRLWYVSLPQAWICLGLTLLGILFAWWARIHLGRLWSGAVVKKEGHKVVDTGPYRIVRHPIYTGLLLSVLATMAAKGTALGVVGAAIILVGIWLKARLEESFLAKELGPEYRAYAERVPMLVPFGL